MVFVVKSHVPITAGHLDSRYQGRWHIGHVNHPNPRLNAYVGMFRAGKVYCEPTASEMTSTVIRVSVWTPAATTIRHSERIIRYVFVVDRPPQTRWKTIQHLVSLRGLRTCLGRAKQQRSGPSDSSNNICPWRNTGRVRGAESVANVVRADVSSNNRPARRIHCRYRSFPLIAGPSAQLEFSVFSRPFVSFLKSS